jgi:hypothetical protein
MLCSSFALEVGYGKRQGPIAFAATIVVGFRVFSSKLDHNPSPIAAARLRVQPSFE